MGDPPSFPGTAGPPKVRVGHPSLSFSHWDPLLAGSQGWTLRASMLCRTVPYPNISPHASLGTPLLSPRRQGSALKEALLGWSWPR